MCMVYEDVQLKGPMWTWGHHLTTDNRGAQADTGNDPHDLEYTTIYNTSTRSFPCHQGHKVTAGRFLTHDSLLINWVDSQFVTVFQQHEAALGKGHIPFIIF